MLKTIFFDLGNVLVFFSHPKMFRQIADCCGLTADEVKKILVDKQVQKAYESGKIDSQEIFRIFQVHSNKSFTVEELMYAASDIFTPNIELWPVVKSLKEEGCKLVLLSNISACHFHRVTSCYPILRSFDDRILSYEQGVMKPDKKIFIKALEKAGCDPQYCFYTDDVPEFIAGAKKVGLDGEIFTGVPALREALAKRGAFQLS